MQKHFKKKELIILRACNELLRRLSRAEDTVFCGRVFIFMFQSFPLGDRSSVNLRGEYHVENITVFEDLPAKVERSEAGAMEVDSKEQLKYEAKEEKLLVTASATKAGDSPEQAVPSESSANSASKEQVHDNKSEADALYPIFWALQESFSMPTRLFDTKNFNIFKNGLDLTIRKFQSVYQEFQARGTSRLLDDNKRTLKRKRSSQEEDVSNSINPRYLTSRDLFDLEVRKSS